MSDSLQYVNFIFTKCDGEREEKSRGEKKKQKINNGKEKHSGSLFFSIVCTHEIKTFI